MAEDSLENQKSKAPSSKAAKKDAYLVLARKYRPNDFSDLIGQDAMVQTLRNAFASNRIAQSYMLSGVRGVGKTTTARILARALNYETDQIDEPRIDIEEPGRHCPAIMAGTHVDVMEMDAASHTGIDDIREIIEAARYKPVSARYKVYIIDEVHMLSKSAFNGLLKTLEEPPAHVKFIFATTELRKVPVTVLSRCQRFDLRRIDIHSLEQHYTSIASQEKVKIDPEAINLVARASEGSVRDGLSLLDQAFARAGKKAISADDIRSMLGLADKAEILNLLHAIFKGDAALSLKMFREFYEKGGDPQQIISDMADAVHSITRTKATQGALGQGDEPEAAKEEIETMAKAVSMAILHRAWQTLLKGYEEVSGAPNQLSAAEMVILRLIFMADLPNPADLITALKHVKQGAGAISQGQVPQGQVSQGQAPQGQVSQGQAPQGQMTQGQDTQVQAPQNQTSQELSSQDHNRPHSRASDGPSSKGNVVEVQMGRTVNGPDHQAAPDVFEETLEAPETPSPAKSNSPLLQSFADVVELLGKRREVQLKIEVEEYAELVSFATGRIELHVLEGASDGIASELSTKLTKWTGARWMVALSHERGKPTIGSVRRIAEQKELEQIKSHPAVEAAMKTFPGAKIASIKPIKPKDD